MSKNGQKIVSLNRWLEITLSCVIFVFSEYDILGTCIVQVSGIMPPKPTSSFAHFGFDEQLMKTVRKAKYTTPMPIQAQVVFSF